MTDGIFLAYVVTVITGALLALRVVFRRSPPGPKLCGSCRFFDQSACRRYPPARVYTGDMSKDPNALDVNVWPVIKADNWCGEHQRKP